MEPTHAAMERGRTSGRERLRVLLVDPYLRREDPMERKGEEQYPSLGLLSISAFLREAGHDVRIVDLTFERSLEPVREALRSFDPLLLGVHTKTLTFPRASAIAGMARRRGTFTLAGGPDASSRPDSYLQAGFDAVATGEGETTLLEVASAVGQGRTLFGIPGVSFEHHGGTVHGPARKLVRDLDELPLPAWDLVDMEAYLGRWERSTGSRRMAVLTSRGCPFDCSWCSKPTFGRTFRQRSVPHVLRELKALHDLYQVDYVRICDDVFGIQRRWTESFLDGLIEEDLGLRFECLSRVDLLKPSLLPRMAKAGLHRVFLGVESGSQKMLDAMNRGTKIAQIERCATALREHHVNQYWFLMMGYPGETLEDIERTLTLFRRFSPEGYSISIAMPLPGTRLERVVAESGSQHDAASARPPFLSGGGLLYEGVYPLFLYRWQKLRFRLAKALRENEGKFEPGVLQGIEHASDELGRWVVNPLVLEPVAVPRRRKARRPKGRKRSRVDQVRLRAKAGFTELRERIAPEVLRRIQGGIPGRPR